MLLKALAATVIFLTLHLARDPVCLVSGEASASCEEGSFLCIGTEICLEQRFICDGKENCPNGTDEIDCVDEWSSTYFDHIYKKRPSALLDDLKSKCELSYNGSCTCKDHSLICHHKNYKKAPDDIPHGWIHTIDFYGNPFEILSSDSLAALPIEVDTLVLTHCSISEIWNGTFYRLPSLKVLYLDNNALGVFPAALFPPKSELTKLVLGYNQLEHIQDGAFDDLDELLDLELNSNKLSELDGNLLRSLPNLEFLVLSSNLLTSIDDRMFPSLPLKTLSLENNRIESIAPYSFASLSTLENLYLANNWISALFNGTFENLSTLRSLNLQNNRIRIIEDGVFMPTYSLNSLDFRDNPFRSLNKTVLGHLTNLSYIYFDRMSMCIESAPRVRNCDPKSDGISSIYNLLDNPLLRASVWVMGIVGCTGNLLVFLGRLLTTTTNKVHSLYIKNLAVSDLLMGVYLLIIASIDQRYRGIYWVWEKRWRASTTCSVCGFLSTLSCESSVLILSLVTWDRLISITQPFARRQPSPKAAGLTLAILWSIAIMLAAAPLLPTELTKGYFGKSNQFYGNNGMCLSLHIHEPYDPGWQYSAAMFICVNTLALILICYAYLRMIHEIKASGIACRSTQQTQERDKVAQRFGVIVLTDCLCWVPVIFVKLAAFTTVSIPDTLYAWLAIFVLPINSALNPVLYTLTTTVFKKQMRKIYNSCIHKRKKRDNQNSGYDSSFSLSLGIFPIGGGSTKRTLTYRGTQTSLASTKNSCRRSTAV